MAHDLSKWLSQTLVAFTIEFDNEFEKRMIAAGYLGARVSLVVWANVLRFVAEGPVSVGELAARALSSLDSEKFQLGCLERWGYIALPPAKKGEARRDGWGSGRGVRADWTVRLTSKGRTAAEIWPPLFGLIEQRWRDRFGDDEIKKLRDNLEAIVTQLDLELPEGLPPGWLEMESYPPRVTKTSGGLSLATLLSRLLIAFRVEFDKESRTPLALGANTIRVLGEKPKRVAEIPLLTGASPETSGIGWQLKPYIVVESDPGATRGKVVRLSERGLQAQKKYHRLLAEIEGRWELRYGKEQVRKVAESLRKLFEDRSLMSETLTPPPGVVRAGAPAPALGRKDVGPAARQRMRDLVVQTEAFVGDPSGTLPHYPLWDMNRGFGP